MARQSLEESHASNAMWVKPVAQLIDTNVVKWKALLEALTKCNIDDAFCRQISTTSWSMCCHSAHGVFVSIRTLWKEPCLHVPKGEAMGLLQTLH